MTWAALSAVTTLERSIHLRAVENIAKNWIQQEQFIDAYHKNSLLVQSLSE